MTKLKKIIYLIIACLFLNISETNAAMDPDLAFVTATLFSEAGGETVQDVYAIASVIVNRRNYYQKKARSGVKVKLSDVCLGRYQFSFWNNKRNWTVANIERWAQNMNRLNKASWNRCLEIAKMAINGTLKDTTGGATAFYASWMDKGKTPKWARGQKYSFTSNSKKIKLIYGVGLSPLKTWHSANSIAGGGGGGDWNGSFTGVNGSGGSNDQDIVYYKEEYKLPPECGEPSGATMLINNDIMKHRLFAEDILINMEKMMVKIYQSLGGLFARGHALMCYATNVSPLCLDGGGGMLGAFKSIASCSLKVPLLNYFIPGVLIYITGFFLCMSIGMYFVDISFKLGFAVLFLPLSISLWPFPPTQSKLTENISIIIHSAMLFAFAAIGTAYAVLIISAAMGMEETFWKVINDASSLNANSGLAELGLYYGKGWAKELTNSDDSMEKFSQNFSISSTYILVILFSLFFAFKILAASINNYLNYFFGDGSLGAADNAMHHMGTQAVGFIKNNTVDPAARLVRDVAMTQGGRALEGVGNFIDRHTPNTKFGGGAAPVTAGKAMPMAQNPHAKPIQPAKPTNGGKGADGDAAEDLDKPDTFTNEDGANTENNQQTDNNQSAANNNSQPNAENQPQTESSSQQTAQVNGSGEPQTENSGGKQPVNNQQATKNSNKTQQNNNRQAPNEQQQTNNQQQVPNESEQQAPSAQQAPNENPQPDNQPQDSGGQPQADNQQQTPDNNNSGQQAPAAQQTNEQPQTVMQQINTFSRPTGHSLTVGNAFKAVRHPQQAYRTIKKLAQQGVQDWQQADSLKDKGSLVLKKSGQVVVRSVRGNAVEATGAGMKVGSGFLKYVGKKMQSKPAEWQKERQQRRGSGSQSDYDRQREEEWQREQERINSSYD